ncbi:hypothetical protein LWV33_06570 [Brucella intermedia]
MARLARFHHDILSLKVAAERKRALQNYEPPKPQSVVGLLDGNRIATVEDLRALMLEELGNVQIWLKGADTDPLATLYPGGKRVDENTARNRVVDWLRERLLPHNAGLVIEHQMAAGNRCDITAALVIGGKRHLVVTEVKGQWHSELFQPHPLSSICVMRSIRTQHAKVSTLCSGLAVRKKSQAATTGRSTRRMHCMLRFSNRCHASCMDLSTSLS